MTIQGILSDSEGISRVKLLCQLQIPWLKVVFTPFISCLKVFLRLILAGSSVFKTVLLDLWPIQPNTHISLLILHWLANKYRSGFKITLLLYKFLHSNYLKYFEPCLKPRHSLYRNHRSPSDGFNSRSPIDR